MNMLSTDCVILQPENKELNFTQKQTRNGDIVWVSSIVIKNINEYVIAVKIMTTAPKVLNCYPPACVLNSGGVSKITLVSKSLIRTNCYVKVSSIRVSKDIDQKDEFEILDLFKEAKQNNNQLQGIKFTVNEFSSSENVSSVNKLSYYSDNKGLEDQYSCLKMSVSQQKIQHSIRQSQVQSKMNLESSIFQLQKDQQYLIQETRELNKSIVLTKAQNGLPIEEYQEEESLKFTKFQLLTIAILSILIGFYLSD